ncbi:MAG TPA: archease [Planctomycetota bacterium]|nr:archease [Planctomycetota bacterium]
MSGARWEHFAHGADIGVRGRGATREEAFEQCALALTAVITDPAGVGRDVRVELAVQAAQDDLLLLEFLNMLVYEMAVRRWLCARCEVAIAGAPGGRLTAVAWGERVDVARHQPAVEVKGATLTELAVTRDAGGRWRAQCVVDV